AAASRSSRRGRPSSHAAWPRASARLLPPSCEGGGQGAVAAHLPEQGQPRAPLARGPKEMRPPRAEVHEVFVEISVTLHSPQEPGQRRGAADREETRIVRAE